MKEIRNIRMKNAVELSTSKIGNLMDRKEPGTGVKYKEKDLDNDIMESYGDDEIMEKLIKHV